LFFKQEPSVPSFSVSRIAGKNILLAFLSLACCLAQAQNQTLTVTAYPAVDEIIKSAIPTWNKLHPDVEIRLISREMENHHTAMTTALSTRSNLPDVMALEFSRLGRFASAGGLEDLAQPPYLIGQYQSHYVPFAYKQGTTKTGAVVAAPTDIGPGTMLYRTDVLQKAGVTVAELTQSWESFVATGLKIKARTGAYLVSNAGDVKDILIRSGIKPGDGLYFDAQGNVLVDSPRFVRAFELARTIRQNKLDGKIPAWSNDWTQGFKTGAIATQMSGAWLVGHMAAWIAPTTKGLWRVTQLPDKTWAAWGGTFYVIPKNAQNKAMAWEFIKLMTLNRDLQLNAFKVKDAFPALLDAHTDPFYDEPLVFLGGQKARQWWREAAMNIQPIGVNKLDNIADEVVNTELDKVLSHGKDIRAALADAKALLDKRAHRYDARRLQ
jgi:multiple sugar transport system substrate-binding protein